MKENSNLILLETGFVILGAMLFALPWMYFTFSVDTQGIASGWAMINTFAFPIPYLILRWIPYIKKKRNENRKGLIITSFITGFISPILVLPTFFVLISLWGLIYSSLWSPDPSLENCWANYDEVIEEDGIYYFVGDRGWNLKCGDLKGKPFTGKREKEYGIQSEIKHILFYQEGKLVRTKIMDGCGEEVLNDGIHEFSCSFFLSKVSTKGNVKDGKPEGLWESYHLSAIPFMDKFSDPSLNYTMFYVDGKPEGLYESYWANGTFSNRGSYKDGKEEGYHENYNSYGPDQGFMTYRTFFKDGKEIFEDHFNYQELEDSKEVNPDKLISIERFYNLNDTYTPCAKETYDEKSILTKREYWKENEGWIDEKLYKRECNLVKDGF